MNEDNTTHDHACHCGGVEGAHPVGAPGCFRYMSNNAVVCLDAADDRWAVNGEPVSGFTLREQRGYAQHPCGCWSKHGGSTNSLEVE